MPFARCSTAATGSLGMPSVRANTLVDPPGSTPSAVSVPAIPVATSFERAVAAVADDHVETPSRGVVGEARGVTAPVGLDDLDVVSAAESAVHHHGVAAP